MIFIQGMQQNVILEAEPRGLPQFHKILPQYLNSVGYESHLVGKWHLGFYEQKYTPTYRGFKSFFGFWQGHHDYFSHLSHETVSIESVAELTFLLGLRGGQTSPRKIGRMTSPFKKLILELIFLYLDKLIFLQLVDFGKILGVGAQFLSGKKPLPHLATP